MAITPTTAVVTTADSRAHYLEWGPVILGALCASALSVVLLTFGAALGLSVVSPYPYAGISAKGLAVLGGTFAALVTVASFGAGGYLAGRARTPWGSQVGASGDLVESHFRDGTHGFAVWALGVVLGAALAASGVGGILKAAVQSTTAVAAAGAAGAAANPAIGAAATNRLSIQPTDYAVDRIMAPAPGGTAPAAGAAAAAAASRPDMSAPIARTFAANLRNPQLDARDRTYLVQVVMQQTGMPQADAEKRVDEAFTELKAAEQKARDAAEQARKASLIAAFLMAATLAIGCAAACGGAALGARHRDEKTVVVLFGSSRFW